MAVPFVGWGDGLIDYDNDGWKDLMMINGHVYPQVDEHAWGTTYAERPLLFHNNHHGKFDYVPPVKGSGFGGGSARAGRRLRRPVQQRQDRCRHQPRRWTAGAAQEREPQPSPLGRTQIGRRRRPKTGRRSPRDAVGATVYLTANGMRQREDVMSGGSYISSNDQRAHFGLGDATDAGTAEIHWPSGQG